MRNLHKAYYKDYFLELNYLEIGKKEDGRSTKKEGSEKKNKNQIEIEKRNDILTSAILVDIPNEMMDLSQSFSYVIAYPGLVTGVGINHEAKIRGEFKLGVHFDYTYGMPVVYGSSVKGVLRAYFKDIVNEDFSEDISPDFVDAAFKDIFCGMRDGKPTSIYDRDLFFDAVITKGYDDEGRILASDSITPHKDGPLKDPIPLTFLKIAPGCTLEFRFRLKDSIIPAKLKLEIFKKIITTFGIGAKTNVGYGQFET